jgi:uncharacterized BrkB/YihY/UPF0761 family membrane protein
MASEFNFGVENTAIDFFMNMYQYKKRHARACLPIIIALIFTTILVCTIVIPMANVARTLVRNQDYTWASWCYLVYQLIIICVLFIYLEYLDFKSSRKNGNK